MRHCKDCEPAQEIHTIAYLSVLFGYLDQPFFYVMEFLFKNTAEAISNKFSIPFFKLMVFLRLGRFTEAPNKKDTLRTKCFWDEAIRRGIKMREFHLGPIKDGFIAEYKGPPRLDGLVEAGKTIIFDGLPRPGLEESDSLKWMDDKGVMKEKFLKEGLPVARGGVAFTKRKALQIFNSLQAWKNYLILINSWWFWGLFSGGFEGILFDITYIVLIINWVVFRFK